MTIQRPFTHLVDIPLFASLDAQEEAALLQGAARRVVPGGRVIQWEGEQAEVFSVVIDGRAKAVLQRKDGGEILLRFLGPGDFFGELNLCGCPESPYSVVALEDCNLMLVSLSTLAALVRRNGELGRSLVNALGRQLLQSHIRVRTLSADRSERRILGVLRELAMQIGITREDGILVPEKISHQSLADSAGLTRETVTRLIRRLREQGFLTPTPQGWLLARRLFEETSTGRCFAALDAEDGEQGTISGRCSR